MAYLKNRPWHPITDPVDLKHLGKLSEELSECLSAVSRCIIQGIHECEPVTHKPNRLWLEEEIADVFANLTLVMEHFKLDKEFIVERADEKHAKLKEWHKEAKEQ